MSLYPYFVACLKQCIVGVPETSRLILKVYLFVFALFLDKQTCVTILNYTLVLVFLDKNVFGVICETS